MVKQNKRSLFSYFFSSYLVLAVLLLLFFVGSLVVTDITGELERNNYKYYYGKVDQKRVDLERVLFEKWYNMNLMDSLVHVVREKAAGEDAPGVDTDVFSSLTDTVSLLEATGGLVAFQAGSVERDSVFIKNSNTKTSTSVMGNFTMYVGDFLLAKETGVALSDRWVSSFSKANLEQQQLIRYIFDRFEEKGENFFWYRYNWGSNDSFMLFLPVLEDDLVVAIIGIQINENLLKYYLNYIELAAAKKAAYAIAKYNPVYDTYTNEFINGPHVAGRLPQKPLHFRKITDVNFVTYSGSNYMAYQVDQYVAIAVPLRISDADDDWVLVAYIPKDEFYVHAASMRDLLVRSALITLFLSVGLAFVIAKLMTAPIKSVIGYAENKNELTELSISEYNQINHLVKKMVEGVSEGNERLDFVLHLLQTKMIVIKHELDTGVVSKYGVGSDLLTYLFGDDEGWPTTVNAFGKMIDFTYGQVVGLKYHRGKDYSYKILEVKWNNKSCYIKSVVQIEKEAIYYFLMDYTQEVMNEQRLAYEIEYDKDTGLLNRESFKKKVSEYLAENPDVKAALVMWVVEDLEYVNQVCGYNFGDEYVNSVGLILSGMIDSEIFVSRYSSNKYVTFIPFPQMREKVIAMINEYSLRISRQKVRVNDHKELGIKLTKGISWYPSDSADITQLCTYAEFASNSAAKRARNSNHQFSLSSYENHVLSISAKEHFERFIDKKEFDFAFQPVISLEEKKIIGYEALMRPSSQNLMYVDDVLRMAETYGQQGDVEVMTMQEVFKKILNRIDQFEGKLVFINSIRDFQISKRALGSYFDEDLDQKIVIDISGVEKMESDALWNKANWVHSNEFKLCFDKFGEWYSSGQLITTIKPDYIKISREIVRNVHEEPEKQRSVREIVRLCEEHQVKLIAVGVEQREELAFLRSAGVEYAQGFLLAEPEFELVDFLEDDAVEILDSI